MDVPEWLAVLCVIIGFSQGFITAGMIYSDSPFWDGFRDIYSFGYRHWKRRA